MVLLAKRVSALRPPEMSNSTSSAVECLRNLSKMEAAWSWVSIQHSALSIQPSCGVADVDNSWLTGEFANATWSIRPGSRPFRINFPNQRRKHLLDLFHLLIQSLIA